MGIIDSLTKNPGLLALAALGIGLFIFRDKISGFFSDITGGAQGAAQIAETGGILGENLQSNLTGIQDILSGDIFKGFEFPKLEFPTFELPTFEFPNINLDLGKIFAPRDPTDITETPAAEGRADDRGRIFSTPIIDPIRTMLEGPTRILVPQADELGFGGGPSFMGGVTTLGNNIIDSLSEVLSIFPGLTASQARDALEENPGLTGSQFGLINPDVINISNAFEGGDTGPVTSDPNFTGLTPQQIATLLTGGNISNF